MSFVVLLVLNLLVWGGFFWFFRAQIRKTMGSAELLSEIRSEVDLMVKELNLTAERNIGVLEERLVKLEVLLRQADQRLTLWSKEEEKRALPLVYTRPRPEPLVVTPPTTSSATKVEIQPVMPSELPSALAPNPPKQFTEPSAVKDRDPHKLRERVLSFRAEGFSALEIAQKTSASLAEVELILSLYPLRA